MSVETTKMSSRGQVVIPQVIREEIEAQEGTVFAVFGSKNTIILRKVDTPSKESLIKDLESIAKEGRKRIVSKGFKEADIREVIERRRKNEGSV